MPEAEQEAEPQVPEAEREAAAAEAEQEQEAVAEPQAPEQKAAPEQPQAKVPQARGLALVLRLLCDKLCQHAVE